jgi:hypothetical protein
VTRSNYSACGTLRGTVAGYGRHKVARQPSCRDCRVARAAYDRAYRAKEPSRLRDLHRCRASLTRITRMVFQSTATLPDPEPTDVRGYARLIASRK